MGVNYGDRRLLDKYNLSISCLDYSYIKNSSNEEELEKILLILRSGEEGTYPDLVKFCENRLREVSPNNKLLQVIKSVSSLVDLPVADQSKLRNDIKTWIEDIKLQDKGLVGGASSTLKKEKKFPIRNSSIEEDESEDKPNADKMENPLLYGEDMARNEEDSNLQYMDQQVNDLMKKLGDKKHRSSVVNVSGLSDDEKMDVADKEKTKGNECFKAQDYVESIYYYSRSLSAYPTTAALNNRALSYIKRENYAAAILDCDDALNLEPDNVKAFYRRGLAYKETGRMQLAFMDFQTALDLDPTCKAAREKLEEMNMCPRLISSNKSPVIEEIPGSKKILRASNYTDKSSVSNDKDSVQFMNDLQQNLQECPEEKKRKIVPKPNKVDSNPPTKDLKTDLSIKDEDIPLSASFKDVRLDSLESVKKKIPAKNVEVETEKLKNADVSFGRPDKLPVTSSEPNALPNVTVKGNKPFFESTKERMTPFKFLNLWHNSNASKNHQAGADMLRQISPEKLPSYITNKLDADILNGIIMAITEIVNSGNWIKGYEFMKQLGNIPRITIVLSFLSATEQNEIENLLLLIEENQKTDMMELKETLLEKTLTTKFAK